IDADGKALASRAAEVVIDYLAEDGARAERVGRCEFETGALHRCDFPRARSGRYRLTAGSGSAAPTSIERYVWTGVAEGTHPPGPVLEATAASSASGTAARVMLQRVAGGRPVLLVASQKGRILSYLRSVTPEGAGTFDLQLPPGIHGELQIAAWLRDPAGGAIAEGRRTPAAMTWVETTLAIARPAVSGIVLAFGPDSAAPGQRATLSAHNVSAEPRVLTLSVMDDAVRALAGDFLRYSDPLGAHWLGRVDYMGRHATATASFAEWNRGPWSTQLRTPRTAEEPPAMFDDPSPVDAPAPPLPVADMTPPTGAFDRIEVTGSRLPQADLAVVPGRRPEGTQQAVDAGASGLIARLARVRGRFASTAFWSPHVTLQPGERRTFEVALPDNLTRWRAVAWSTGAADDFQQAEATLAAGLPVEARLQAPVRLYVGDRTRVVGNARQAGAEPRQARVMLQARGAGVTAAMSEMRDLSPGGQAPFDLEIAPDAVGVVETTAAAATSEGSDGVGARVEVAGTRIEGRRVQAGWLPDGGVQLEVPALPPGAVDPRLQVALLRGGAGLIDRWSTDLNDYPHRCWEQILSRAVGAALAIERHDPAWPDAQAVVAEALRNAAVFQDAGGRFHFFAEAGAAEEPHAGSSGHAPLTAYSVHALELLQSLGHAVPVGVLAAARNALEGMLQDPVTPESADAVAFAASAVDSPLPVRDALWQQWDGLALPVQLAVAQGLDRTHDARAAETRPRLLARAPRRGEQRTVTAAGDWSVWMGSALREQCQLIRLLQHEPALRQERRQLLAGLTDLYAGGIERTDTQSAAFCLLALRGEAADRDRPIDARLRVQGMDAALRIASGNAAAQWDGPATGVQGLAIAPATAGQPASSYVAQLSYQEDARRAQASAVGMSVERHYAVLRDGAWRPLADTAVAAADWVRVTLVVSTSAPRHFVALVDEVPGGLQPTDLRLRGVGGLDLVALSDTGSSAFATRRLDPRRPRFYAQWLPPGRHEVHYFARAGNQGDFLAAPASVELMYGQASRARTAGSRLEVVAPR
ncbi:MAG TPA: alpha-2-macroglobulin family protein, partial [Luteimonas sp.]|nr:alpha-2-macroglobulin family protein [Luteimonas sp.]